MMISEFIERTDYEVNGREYQAIEQIYNFHNDWKDEFCRKFMVLRNSVDSETYSAIIRAINSLLDNESDNIQTIRNLKNEVSNLENSLKTATSEFDLMKEDFECYQSHTEEVQEDNERMCKTIEELENAIIDARKILSDISF